MCIWHISPFKMVVKKKTCFTGRRTCQVVSIGREIFYHISFFFLVAKMTPLQTQKFPKNLTFFEKNFGKVFLVIFKNFQPNFLRLWLKTDDFSKLKKKKKFSQNGKYASVVPVKQGFLFCGLSTVRQHLFEGIIYILFSVPVLNISVLLLSVCKVWPWQYG